ncbi:MAG: SURF1 family protein [Burkholderiales bacterium]
MLVALTTWAGFWQLERAREKTQIAERARETLRAPPLTIAPGEINPGDYNLRRVAAQGVFDPESTIYLDNKVREGVAGYEVLSLLRLEGGRKPVLVNRGWIAQGPTRDELPGVPLPQGEVTIEGVAQLPSERVLELSDETIQGKVWQNLDLERYRAVFRGDVQPFVILQQSTSADGLKRDWKFPNAGAGKHRAYAVQWFALAALTVTFYFAVGRREKT